ncbi:hypothetical protein PC9H_008949 [Pleurotus ostreatus]|uniref:Uncharacterized protein n=2 Tax=Pleurotus ostreatus TaxID=5322 RepID=A0A8H6ZWT8_PLEOS|nr:uncharacterized protein PC9H_008949 [Pleurotus ostreatus]KAF7426580.1 hypothetical protein PC9H_008949 [Pleurotus ostreatus]
MTRSRKARSKASKDAHLAKYLASASRAKALKGLEANTERQHIQFNDLATRLPSNAERLNRVIARNFPGLNAENLQPADSNHRLFFAEDTTGNPLAMRISNVISRTTAFRLENACRKLDSLGPKIHHREANRSATSALHLGIWETYAAHPRVSRDTIDQEPPVLDVIAKILRILQEDVAPKLGALLMEHYPAQWARQTTAYDRVRRELSQELAAMPWLDFGGAFFTVAIKVGSSEHWHVDRNDDRGGSIAWVVPVGEFTGGDFCSPQPPTRIAVRRGQVLGVQARRLIHCGLKTTGVCHVFTLFTDGLLLKLAEEGK